jgi:hypothetical protein
MAKKKKNSKPNNPVERELVAIKRLLVTLLYKLGASLKEISLALQMDEADTSRTLPARKIKSIVNNLK